MANAIADQFAQAQNTTANYNSPWESKVNDIARLIENENLPNTDLSTLTSYNEVISFIKSLKNSKAPGLDQVSNLVLKKLPRTAYNFMVTFFNFCIQKCYFPLAFKKAKVIAICKNGKDPKLPTSYRPISLLSALDKILEKIILNRLKSFVEENNLIHSCQYGFRSQHSTTHQLKRVVNIIKSNKNRRYSTGVIFLDIEKAFDSIWHKGLIYKLHKIDCPLYLIRLINSFLTNRSFIVELSGTFSAEKSLLAGVPQGSVLSPILYNLYISDFQLKAGNDVAFYADDSAFISYGKVSNAIVKRMQKALIYVFDYFTNWKIKINNDKTQAILFPYNKSPKRNPSLKLFLQSREITFSNSIKYLGVTLDKKLTYKQHIENICYRAIRCGRALYPLLNRKSILSVKNKLLLYKLCIRPILTYGCVVWKDCASSHRKRIQIIQNKNLKIIYNLQRRFSTMELHRISGQKTIDTLINDMSLLFFDKCSRSNFAHLRCLLDNN